MVKTKKLVTTIDESSKKLHTQSLDISFNELLDMYKNEELNITPECQRLFLWSEGQRSRFIESLLLEIPVPPIFVIEEDDGKYTLIDGLQRISSYLHFRGELVAPYLNPPVEKGDSLVLSGCDITTELNGKTFNDIDTSLQIRLKRAFVRVEVVRKCSNPHFKYYMFKRLNTGGTLLSDQQIRNCTIRLLSPVFNEFIIKLSKDESFRNCIGTIGDSKFLSAFDQELVLRFFALKNYRENYRYNLGDFLTEYMEAVSEPDDTKRVPFDYAKEEEVFRETFRIFDKTLGSYSFGFNKTGTDTITRFSTNNYEALTIGIQPFLKFINVDSITAKLTKVLKDIKKNDTYKRLTTGAGKNNPSKRINFVTEHLGQNI
jgi:hypothetical protein